MVTIPGLFFLLLLGELLYKIVFLIFISNENLKLLTLSTWYADES